MNIILRGIILGLSITAPIGPTNIEIIRRSTTGGWRAAANFCLGVMVSLVIYLVIVAFGLSYVTESPYFTTILTVFGVLVLAYLAYKSISDFFTGTVLELEGQTQAKHHFTPGIVLTLANPAILLLWTGIMGADLASSEASAAQGLLLSSGILIGVALFFSALTILIHYSRRLLQQKYTRYVSLIAGIVLLIFCLQFAWDLLSHLL